MLNHNFHDLRTESTDQRSEALDTTPPLGFVQLMNTFDREAADAVKSLQKSVRV